MTELELKLAVEALKWMTRMDFQGRSNIWKRQSR